MQPMKTGEFSRRVLVVDDESVVRNGIAQALERLGFEVRLAETGAAGLNLMAAWPAAMKMLTLYPWPGNVRELEHTVERILILEDGDLIQPEHLPSFISGRQGDFQVFSDGELTLEEVERRYLQFILRRTKGNQSEAARILGINRKTLGQKIQKYNLRTSF